MTGEHGAIRIGGSGKGMPFDEGISDNKNKEWRAARLQPHDAPVKSGE